MTIDEILELIPVHENVEKVIGLVIQHNALCHKSAIGSDDFEIDEFIRIRRKLNLFVKRGFKLKHGRKKT